MRYLFVTMLFCAATIVACDDRGECITAEAAERPLFVAPPPESLEPEIEFREQGPPHAQYITKYQGKAIFRTDYAALILACGGLPDPALTCTMSWYAPDTTKDSMVLGLGCSMLAPAKVWSCYNDLWLKNDAKPLK